MKRKTKQATKQLKVAYGESYRAGFILSPVKGRPAHAIIPCAVFETRAAAETAAAQHGYRIEWQS